MYGKKSGGGMKSAKMKPKMSDPRLRRKKPKKKKS